MQITQNLHTILATKRSRFVLWFGITIAFVLSVALTTYAADRLLIDFDALTLNDDGTVPGWDGKEFATSLVLTDDEVAVSIGKFALRGELNATPDGNRRAMVTWNVPEEERDWTAIKGVIVDVYNPNADNLRMGLAVQTGDGWMWQEIAPVPLPPGWTKDIYYAFDETVWKSSSTGWSYVALPQGLDDLRGLNFLVVALADGEHQFTIDNIRVRE